MKCEIANQKKNEEQKIHKLRQNIDPVKITCFQNRKANQETLFNNLSINHSVCLLNPWNNLKGQQCEVNIIDLSMIEAPSTKQSKTERVK